MGTVNMNGSDPFAPLSDEAEVTVKVGELREMLATAARAGAPEILTTPQAERFYGLSRKYWREEAEAGRIPGAWQDGDGGDWRLPREGVVSHIRQKQALHTSRKSRLRGPRSAQRGRVVS